MGWLVVDWWVRLLVGGLDDWLVGGWVGWLIDWVGWMVGGLVG